MTIDGQIRGMISNTSCGSGPVTVTTVLAVAQGVNEVPPAASGAAGVFLATYRYDSRVLSAFIYTDAVNVTSTLASLACLVLSLFWFERFASVTVPVRWVYVS